MATTRDRGVLTALATGVVMAVTTATAALMVLGTLATPAAAAKAAASAPATPRAAPAGGVVTHSTHIGYQNCPAPDVLLSASIRRQSFMPGQLVTYTVTVHNLTHRPCGIQRGLTQPTIPSAPVAALGLLGPCGQIPVVIDDPAGTNIYPGPGEFGCPMLLGPRLAAGQSITATGTWDQSAGFGHGFPGTALPPGHYRLVIDGKLTLPIVLSGAAFPTPPTLPTPTLPTPTPNPTPTPLVPGSGLLPLPSTPLPAHRALPTPTVPSNIGGSPSRRTTTTIPARP